MPTPLKEPSVCDPKTHPSHASPGQDPPPDEPRLPAVGFSLPALVALSQFARSRRGALQALAHRESSSSGRQSREIVRGLPGAPRLLTRV